MIIKNCHKCEVIKKTKTKYQDLLLVELPDESISLYLDNELQFNSKDEHKYHEALVHPVMTTHPKPAKILVLGGGDGFVIRELLKYPTISDIYLVDIDEEMVELFRDDKALSKLNNYSLTDPRVKVINQDAFEFLETTEEQFDIIIGDLPDASYEELERLYSVEMFKMVNDKLDDYGLMVFQAGSPYELPEYYASVLESMIKAGFYVTPMKTHIPSFLCNWGFLMGSKKITKINTKVVVPTRFIGQGVIESMLIFSNDEKIVSSVANTVDNPVIKSYYRKFDQEWTEFDENMPSEAQKGLSQL